MKRYTRSQIEQLILRLRTTKLEDVSDDYLADNLLLLRRMKKWLDVSAEETKASFTFIRGGKE